jgi:hypothetical protein
MWWENLKISAIHYETSVKSTHLAGPVVQVAVPQLINISLVKLIGLDISYDLEFCSKHFSGEQGHSSHPTQQGMLAADWKLATQLWWGNRWPWAFYNSFCVTSSCRLCGVVVSVLATGPKVRGFEPCQSDGFLRDINTRSTPSSRMGIKAGGPCSKILRHVRTLEVPRGWRD